MDDIFGMFAMHDSKKIDICCVADNVKLLPKYSPEEVEIRSLIERVIKLEEKTADHGKRLDESFAREMKGNSAVEESKREIIKAKNEVETCLKIVNDTAEVVKKQETNVETVKSELQAVKETYAQKANQGRSNAQTVVPEPSSGSGDWRQVSRRRR